MLVRIGTRVILKHTKETGVVIDYIDGDMVLVRIDDGHEIPCFMEDCLPATSEASHTKVSPKPTIEEETKIFISQYAVLNSFGVQIAFEPHRNDQNLINYFDVFIINDLKYNVIYTLEINDDHKKILEKSGTLQSNSAVILGRMPFDVLHDNPVVQSQLTRMSTSGDEPTIEHTLKLKAKTFFQNTKLAPIIHRQVHWFLLAASLDQNNDAETSKKVDLKAYSKSITPIGSKKKKSSTTSFIKHNIEEFSEFNPEIDLHIEKLTSDYQRMTNTEIVHIQLLAMDKFITKALRLGVERVYVIHGVGKGSLKNRIHHHLRSNSNIAFFRNEYHPKFGFGATEIVFF
ncbi:MAG: Smr/MutS family protein [Saprospiraceae bacterium]|nr:Smr/MutS family protein [Saprospiraceae bacterium]